MAQVFHSQQKNYGSSPATIDLTQSDEEEDVPLAKRTGTPAAAEWKLGLMLHHIHAGSGSASASPAAPSPVQPSAPAPVVQPREPVPPSPLQPSCPLQRQAAAVRDVSEPNSPPESPASHYSFLQHLASEEESDRAIRQLLKLPDSAPSPPRNPSLPVPVLSPAAPSPSHPTQELPRAAPQPSSDPQRPFYHSGSQLIADAARPAAPAAGNHVVPATRPIVPDFAKSLRHYIPAAQTTESQQAVPAGLPTLHRPKRRKLDSRTQPAHAQPADSPQQGCQQQAAPAQQFQQPAPADQPQEAPALSMSDGHTLEVSLSAESDQSQALSMPGYPAARHDSAAPSPNGGHAAGMQQTHAADSPRHECMHAPPAKASSPSASPSPQAKTRQPRSGGHKPRSNLVVGHNARAARPTRQPGLVSSASAPPEVSHELLQDTAIHVVGDHHTCSWSAAALEVIRQRVRSLSGSRRCKISERGKFIIHRCDTDDTGREVRLRERFERYWSLSPEEKARKMARDLQVVRLMEATHPGHPALAHGHEAGRSIERGGFYRKSLAVDMILGIYTGVGKTGDEMDKETSKHPTGKGGLVLDKVKTLEQTLDKQQEWGCELVMDANGSHGNMLCMLNDNRGMPSQQTPNVGCMEVEDTEHRMPYLVFFTLRNVQAEEEALLSYGKAFWDHMESERRNRAHTLKLEQELRDARAEIARLMALAQHESMRDPSST